MLAIADGLQHVETDARSADSLSREELLARYRHFREIGKQYHSAVIKLLTKDAILSQAKRLGMARGKTLVAGSMDSCVRQVLQIGLG